MVTSIMIMPTSTQAVDARFGNAFVGFAQKADRPWHIGADERRYPWEDGHSLAPLPATAS